jgi:hypothetical protein
LDWSCGACTWKGSCSTSAICPWIYKNLLHALHCQVRLWSDFATCPITHAIILPFSFSPRLAAVLPLFPPWFNWGVNV